MTAQSNQPKGQRIGRRRFLRQVIGTIGVGAGIALLPEVAAHAAPTNVQCCRDSTCPTCSGTAVRYRCYNYCTKQGFCACYANEPRCFTYPCGAAGPKAHGMPPRE